jgi:hydroxyacylglutathione hydrolase
MQLERFDTPGIAHISYLLANAGEAAVVDPRRDIDAYLQRAHALGVTLKYVIVTHRQEDFVVGVRELARSTGARTVCGRGDQLTRIDVAVPDGGEIGVGGLRLRALHTPGHTPGSTCWAVFDGDGSDAAWGVLTGDSLFPGATGRTDLSDPSRTGENAALLWDALHAKILPLGDQALVLPAHGPGSVCGTGMADRPLTTIGLERLTNPVFLCSREEFVRQKEAERIPRPPYFDRVAALNAEGGIAARPPHAVPVLQPHSLHGSFDGTLVIDTRTPAAFAGGHIPRSLSIWLSGLGVFGGWVAGPDNDVVLVLERPSDVEEARLSLGRIGVDKVRGVLAGGFEAWRDAGLPIEHGGTVTPEQLNAHLREYRVLDVRDDTEVQSGVIPGAQHVYVGHLPDRLGDLRRQLGSDTRIAVTCSVGHRSGLAVSLLLRAGFRRVHNLLGGMTAWQKQDLPTERP